MRFRVRYMDASPIPHVYCQVFVTPREGQTFANCGNLTMRKSEFAEFRQCFKAEFIDNTPQEDRDAVNRTS